jgi:AcrR family transcriptional regulator
MSKATFYEHFDNKEDCILALFDAATERLLAAMQEAGGGEPAVADPRARYQHSIGAFLQTVADYPDYAQTLLVEIIGAGPRAMERRDGVLAAFAAYIDHRNLEDSAAGLVPRLAGGADDAFAIVGAVVELASRQIRTGVPADIRELEPIVERLITGMLAAAEGAAATR